MSIADLVPESEKGERHVKVSAYRRVYSCYPSGVPAETGDMPYRAAVSLCGDGPVSLWIGYKDSSGNVSWLPAKYATLKASDGWKRLEVTGTVPSGMTVSCAGVWAQNAGEWDMSNLTLYAKGAGDMGRSIATASVTVSMSASILAVTRYYQLASATASTPAPPTSSSKLGSWTETEPAADTTKVLYTCERTVYTDGTESWSKASKSTAYEAAKDAKSTASAASTAAGQAKTAASNAQTAADNAASAASKAQTTANSAQTAANTANSKVDGLKVGGRNLFLNTANDTFVKNARYSLSKSSISFGTDAALPGLSVANISVNANANTCGMYFYPIENKTAAKKVTVGETYVISLWAKASAAVTMAAGSLVESHTLVSSSTKLTTSWQRVWAVFKAAKETSATCVYISTGSSAITVSIAGFKLELGNRPTDWTPAPEDLEAATDKVQSNLDAYKTTVSSTYATKAALNTTNDSITAEVSARKQTDTNVTNLQSGLSATNSNVSANSSKITQLGSSITSLVKGEDTYTDPSGKSTTNTLASKVTQTNSRVDTVIATANSAKSTADNLATLIRQSSAGVEVGKTDASGAWQTNRALVSSAGDFQVLAKDGTQLARFASDVVELGRNSRNAVINMCGSAVKIDASKSDDNTNRVDIQAVNQADFKNSVVAITTSTGAATVAVKEVSQASSAVSLVADQVVFDASTVLFDNLRFTWQYIYGSAGADLYARATRFGPVVMLQWDIDQGSSSYWVCPVKLDAKYRPDRTFWASGASGGSDRYLTNNTACIYVFKDGWVAFQSLGTHDYNIGCVSYIAAS